MAHFSVRLVYMLLCICNLQTLATAKKEKLHLTYYGFETRGGPNPTLLAAAGTGQGNLSALGWGTIVMFDNPLREGPTQDSKLVGKYTGSGSATSMEPIFTTGGLYLVTQFNFGPGSSMYNGSSIIVMGRVAVATVPWELIILGGAGYFRGCQGYAICDPVDSATIPPLYVSKWDFYLSCK